MSKWFPRTASLCAMVLIGALSVNAVQAQTKIKDNSVSGTSLVPASNAILELESVKRGMLPPRMDSTQRNSNLPAGSAAMSANAGMIIYNTDEKCIDYYDTASRQWIKLCGSVPAVIDPPPCSNIVVNGTYNKGVPTNSGDYLSFQVNVTSPGAYTITGTTTNGYSFQQSGTFLNAGVQSITLPAQGTPLEESASPGDVVTMSLNGNAQWLTCDANPIIVRVEPALPVYTLNCSGITVNGTYSKNVSLKVSNSISVPVNVKQVNLGQWSITTPTVDGISFSGSGTFTTTGWQTVILNGIGTPTNSNVKTMAITSNSGSADSTTCSATVNCVYGPKTILLLGGSQNTAGSNYGYAMNASASYAVATAAVNFGTPNSIVPMAAPFTINWLTANGIIATPNDAGYNNATGAQLQAQLQPASGNPPDIVVIGWGYSYDATGVAALQTYLNNGGVVLIFNKYTTGGTAASGDAMLLSAVYNTTVTANLQINATGVAQGAGATNGNIYTMNSLSGDPIENGPFNFGNTLSQWGQDWVSNIIMTGLPSNLIVYSGGNVKGGTATSAAANGVTMFRDPSLNLFYCGDGGFLSNYGGTDSWETNFTGTNNTRPFNVTASTATGSAATGGAAAQPIPTTARYGTNAAYGGTNQIVYNSQIFANVLAWAVKQADANGINSDK